MTATSPARRLVLVTGSTRSGTSLAAGTLHHLGLHVPLPVLPPNASNPSGFFESTWPIGFHRRLLDRALVTPTDARPEGFARVAGAVRATDRDELRTWLAGAYDAAPQVVVKDPRATWVPRLWTEVAGEVGATAGLLAMIRHPAEVITSRATYYRAGARDAEARMYHLRNLCTWINLNIGAERITRDVQRLVVRYDDLLADWRGVLRRVRDGFGLDIDLAAGSPGAEAVDAFVDPALRRHEPSWAALDLPAALVEIAEGTWSALGELADGRDGPAAADTLDALGRAYADQLEIATAMARDAALAMVRADRLARGSRGRSADPQAGGHDAGAGRRMLRRWMPLRLRRFARRVGG